MDKPSKRVWTFQTLRTMDTFEVGRHFALWDDWPGAGSCVCYGFSMKSLPQEHVLKHLVLSWWCWFGSLESRGWAVLEEEVGHWGRPWGVRAHQLPPCLPCRLLLNGHSDEKVINTIILTFPVHVSGQKDPASDWTRLIHHILLSACEMSLFTPTKNASADTNRLLFRGSM